MNKFYTRLLTVFSFIVLAITASSFAVSKDEAVVDFSGCTAANNEKLQKCICPDAVVSQGEHLLQPIISKLSFPHKKYSRKYRRLNETGKRFSPSWKRAEPSYSIAGKPLPVYNPGHFLSAQHAFLFRLTPF